MAVAHSLLVIVNRLLERREECKELGDDSFDKGRLVETGRRLAERLEQLDSQVVPQSAAIAD